MSPRSQIRAQLDDMRELADSLARADAESLIAMVNAIGEALDDLGPLLDSADALCQAARDANYVNMAMAQNKLISMARRMG